jgi:uncharacterized protein (TIGR03067 family)
MKRVWLSVLAASLILVWGAGAQDKKELEKLEGKWIVVSVERDGKADESLKDAVRVNTADRYTLTPKDGKAIAGTFKIDPATKPKSMDMMPGEGRYKGMTLLGIYDLEGETLKICFAEPGKERPKEFTSKPGSGVVLAVHHRAKPK